MKYSNAGFLAALLLALTPLVCPAIAYTGPYVTFAPVSMDAALADTNLPGLARPNLTGVWSIVKPVDTINTSDGKLPPLLPASKAIYDQHRAAAARGDRSFDGTTRCLPPGLPRLMLVSHPFEILQRPKVIYFIHELNRLPRRAYLDESLPTDADPKYLGYSVARWDGDTLVIESAGFDDGTLLDAAGLPHSDALHLTERYQLDRGGKRLRAVFTIEDTRTFSAPWSFKAEYVKRRDYELRENVCADRLVAGQ